jgi:hypothetical protein
MIQTYKVVLQCELIVTIPFKVVTGKYKSSKIISRGLTVFSQITMFASAGNY